MQVWLLNTLRIGNCLMLKHCIAKNIEQHPPLPEHEAGLHVDHVPIPTQVLRQKMPQYFHFVLGLLFVRCVIPHHFDGNIFLLLVVKSLQHLTKGALAQQAKYLVPEGNLHT